MSDFSRARVAQRADFHVHQRLLVPDSVVSYTCDSTRPGHNRSESAILSLDWDSH